MNQNNHIVLLGLPGVGKTSIGSQLSSILHIEHIDIDMEIELDKDTAISKLIDQDSEAVFRVLEKEKLKTLLRQTSPLIISSGGGIILDNENRELIRNQSYGIHIKCDIQEIAERIDIKVRPLLYNTNKKDQLLDLWEKRGKFYNEVSKIEVDITGLVLQKAAQKVYNNIHGESN